MQCGNGWLRDHLEKAHPAFVSFLGIDTRDDQITTARMRRPDLTRDFACRDLRSQPLPNDSFDLVIALDGGPPLSELAKIATVAACGRSADGIKIA